VDTTILAALIGAVATIAATWLSRWSPKSRSPIETGTNGLSGPPLARRRWLGYLCWDMVRLSVRNVSVFGLFVVIILSLRLLGIGQTAQPAAEKSQTSRGQMESRQPSESVVMMFAGLAGAAASIGLGVAEALTRWSPWRGHRASQPVPQQVEPLNGLSGLNKNDDSGPRD
jgi:hypothetical protein